MDVRKAELRREILDRLRFQKEETRLKKSKQIKQSLFLQREFQDAKTVMFYIAKSDEVETKDLIKEAIKMGKKVVVPVTDIDKREIVGSILHDFENELEIGPFNVMQPKKENIRPVSIEDIDLVVVPAVAFDQHGNRLGRGLGCFDRFLAKLNKKTFKIGIAFDFQLKDKIPVSCHDIPVTKVITA
ncbi:MAG: 5-formyltetrahydrofolate cyclo-ligase [Candidatus Omnitrophota bacterium]